LIVWGLGVWGLGVWGLGDWCVMGLGVWDLGGWCVMGLSDWDLGGSRTVACVSDSFDLGDGVGTGTSKRISNAIFGFSL
jgi:hypothetical protein